MGVLVTVDGGRLCVDNLPLVQAVKGPLTDAQLRAAAVPVSGTVIANDLPLAILVDEASATITYIGKALPGTAQGSALWSIKKIDTTTGIVTTWADGNSDFDNVWIGHAGLSYS